MLLALAAVLGAAGIAVVLGQTSSTLVFMTLTLLAAASLALITRELRRPLLAAVFLLAPIDITKAVIAPLTSRYYASGPYFSPGLYITLAQMALLALLLVWLGRRLLVERKLPPFTRLDALAFTYLAFIWIRSIGTPQGLLSVGTAASYSLAVLGFYAASHAITDRADMRLVLRASALVLLLTLIYVAAQATTRSQLLLPGAKGLVDGFSVRVGDGGDVFRPTGLMNHPNNLAHYMVIVLPPALAVVLLGPRRQPPALWWLAIGLTGGAGMALLLTLSRGGWASFLLAALVVVAIYVRRGLIGCRQLGFMTMLAVAGAILLVLAYPNVLLRLTAPDSRSLESRVLLADMAYTIIRANPWVGVGFGEFNRAAFQYVAPLYANVSEDFQQQLHGSVAHNHFLLFAAELGIPAVLFFIYLLWRFVRQMWPLTRWRDPGSFTLAIGLTGAMVGQALFLNSDNYYTDIRVFLLWLSAGVMQALTLQADREGAR
jgi:O-antigen ligase